MTATIHVGDCVDSMKAMVAGSVDSIVTDPPYGLEFMGKEWDNLGGGAAKTNRPGIGERATGWVSNVGWNQMRCRTCGHLGHGGSPCICEKPDFAAADDRMSRMGTWHQRWAAEAIRVLKPGGFIVAFGGTRTHHRLACAIEDVGFEIVDTIEWIYGTGFPKAKSQLKPSHEPIILARKPAKRVSPLQIDACRIGAGRWPPNLIFSHAETCFIEGDYTQCYDGCPVAALDAQAGIRKSGKADILRRSAKKFATVYGDFEGQEVEGATYGDVGGASRFFYCTKPSRRERELGLEAMATGNTLGPMAGRGQPGLKCRACGKWKASGSPCVCPVPDFEQVAFERPAVANIHPTVKPVELMRYLVRLITPPGGIVLDPFLGSGTTAIAAEAEGMSAIGCEMNEEYVAIAQARIVGWRGKT